MLPLLHQDKLSSWSRLRPCQAHQAYASYELASTRARQHLAPAGTAMACTTGWDAFEWREQRSTKKGWISPRERKITTRRTESTLARQNRHSRFAASCRRPNGELACTHMLFVPSSRADSSYDLFESEWSALARNTRCVQRSPGKNLPFKPILQTHVSMRLLIGRST